MKKLEFEVTFDGSVCPIPKDTFAYIDGFKSLKGDGFVHIGTYTPKQYKSVKAHKYFFGVVCPCVCHAYFEAGTISKAQFKSLSSDDCAEIVRQLFFVKERLGQRVCKYHSFKISKWGFTEWNIKVQSIIDTIKDRFDYIIPESDINHDGQFLKRLQESV